MGLFIVFFLNSSFASCPGLIGLAAKKCECYETQLSIEKEEYSCSKSSDCYLLQDNCGGLTSVNRKYKKKYKKIFSKSVLPKRKKKNARSYCTKSGICRVKYNE